MLFKCLSILTTHIFLTLAGPANVSISGPNLMNPTVSHTYSCHAYCRPSCNYTWRIDKGAWIGGQGNVISINPREEDDYKTLVCKATNSVSGLFVAATRNIAVASKSRAFTDVVVGWRGLIVAWNFPSKMNFRNNTSLLPLRLHRYEATARRKLA